MIITKLLFKSANILKNNDSKSYSLLNKSIIGNIILPSNNDNKSNNLSIPISKKLDCSEINSLNIIINDCDCENSFFQEICDYLREDGIVFQTDSNGGHIDQDNATVITLDQQYSSGNDIIIFAPYNNTRLGNSDSLVLAIYSAFKQNGFSLGNIVCSKIGYDSNGINLSLPTDTEEKIDEGCNTSFVTISFGMQNIDAKTVAKSIENALMRQKYFIDHSDYNTDLIYRASKDNSIEMISNYFGVSVEDLKACNNINKDNSIVSEAFINPEISKIDAFNEDSIFEISDAKEKIN